MTCFLPSSLNIIQKYFKCYCHITCPVWDLCARFHSCGCIRVPARFQQSTCVSFPQATHQYSSAVSRSRLLKQNTQTRSHLFLIWQPHLKSSASQMFLLRKRLLKSFRSDLKLCSDLLEIPNTNSNSNFSHQIIWAAFHIHFTALDQGWATSVLECHCPAEVKP